MTRKELIERGYIDQYVLGLTNEEENTEVERLAHLYPEIQQQINKARHHICSNFNRNLTQPAIRGSRQTKWRFILWGGLVVSFFSIGFCFLCREHISLQESYTMQCERLAQEQARLVQLASFSKMVNEQSDFLHAPGTRMVKLKGEESFPDAEAIIFQCRNTGKMMLRVIELPKLKAGQHYEVWAHQEGREDELIGQLEQPVRLDSLYALDPVMHYDSLEITGVDPYTMYTSSICSASMDK